MGAWGAVRSTGPVKRAIGTRSRKPQISRHTVRRPNLQPTGGWSPPALGPFNRRVKTVFPPGAYRGGNRFSWVRLLSILSIYAYTDGQ